VIETDSMNFVIAIAFITGMIMLVITAYAYHLVVSGRRLQQTQEKLKALAATLAETEERERKRIAEDLHDRVGEILAASSRRLDELMQQSPAPEFRSELGALRQKLDELKKGAGNLIFALIPSVLYDIGFVEAVEDTAADFSKQHRIAIDVENHLQHHPANQEIATFLLKAIREFMRNAVNHGRASKILVTLKNGDHTVEVIVEDDGPGFTAGPNDLMLKKDSGFGLFNIKTRAEYYQGGIRIAASSTLGGARISVWTPLSLPEENQSR
jgi:signal transduction histidine kinase